MAQNHHSVLKLPSSKFNPQQGHSFMNRDETLLVAQIQGTDKHDNLIFTLKWQTLSFLGADKLTMATRLLENNLSTMQISSVSPKYEKNKHIIKTDKCSITKWANLMFSEDKRMTASLKLLVL